MPNLIYHRTERQQAQIRELLVAEGKKTGQPPKDERSWVFDVLSNAAVQTSIGINSVYDEGRITLPTTGQVIKIRASELEAESMDSDPKWTPDREGSTMQMIKLSESSLLYNSLLKAAKLENVVTRKMGGHDRKHPCLESYIDNILGGALRSDTANNLAKDLMAEKGEVFSEKKDEEKPVAEGKSTLDQAREALKNRRDRERD